MKTILDTIENEYGDVYTVDKNHFDNTEITTSKKKNMHYWDEIQGIVEESFTEIAKFAGVTVEEISEYDDIKEITEMYIKAIEKRFSVKYPVVSED